MLYSATLDINGVKKDIKRDEVVIISNTPIQGGTRMERENARFLELERGIITALGIYYQHENFILTTDKFMPCDKSIAVRYPQATSNAEIIGGFNEAVRSSGSVGRAMHAIYYGMDDMLVMIHTK